jgi:hypothetical protein
MVPSPFVTVVFAFAVYRLTRLLGWDEFPLAVKIRSWVIGEEWMTGTKPELPGKTPSSALAEVRPGYRRPKIAHLVHCPFCLGWWVSLAVYGVWLEFGHRSLYALYPLALSGAAGLLAKNGDKQ